MKSRYLLIPLALGAGLALALVWAMTGAAALAGTRLAGATVAVLQVCPSGCAYSSIQAAVDAAGAGDVVKVAAGTYSGVQARAGVTQVVYISKTVAIRGGYTAPGFADPPAPDVNLTVLDAQRQGRGIYIAGGISPTVTGLIIVRGSADGLGGHQIYSTDYDAGGGVYVSGASVTISDCRIYTSTGSYGGGIHLAQADGTVANSTIANNAVSRYGGGLYLYYSDAEVSGNDVVSNTAGFNGGGVGLSYSEATLSGNDVMSNTGSYGGGLHLDESDATLDANTVAYNRTVNSGGGLYLANSDATMSGNTVSGNVTQQWSSDGGGVYLFRSDAVLTGNAIGMNSTQDGGGGLYFSSSDAVLTGNTVRANSANGDGGGLYLYNSSPTLDNTVVADNQVNGDGAGIFVDESFPYLRHTTLARNRGGSGVHVYGFFGDDSSVTLVNTILVSHTTGIEVTSGSTATLTATLWGSGAWANGTDWGGSGTIFTGAINPSGNPAFVDYGNGDYHIGPSSAAVDAGLAAGLLADIDGDPRPAGFGYDIGADERTGPVLGLYKAGQPALVNPGQTITYTILITNVGTAGATNVVLTDTLPGEQRPMAATASQGSACTVGSGWGGQAVCALGNIGQGATAHVTLTAETTTTLPGSLPHLAYNTVQVKGSNAGNEVSAGIYIHNCHVRIGGNLPEYADVQAALDAAIEGDTVMVAGTCTGVANRGGLHQVAYISKTLTVRGGYSTTNFLVWDPVAYPTVLDAENGGRVVYVAGNVSPTLEGLRLTGGNATGQDDGICGYSLYGGGGIYVLSATATISGVQVYDNSADSGGGVFLCSSGTTLRDSVILDNKSTYETTGGFGGGAGGGGVYLYECDGAMLLSNTIQNNLAQDHAGGVYLDRSDAPVSGNEIGHNAALGSGSLDVGMGGGIYVDRGAPTLDENVIFSNTARYGGGVALFSNLSGSTLTDNVIVSNTCSTNGGGVFMRSSSTTVSGNTIRGNVTRYSGGGMFMSFCSNAIVEGNHVVSNTASSGGGLSLFYTSAMFGRNVILRNSAGYAGGGLEIYSNSHARLFNNVIADNQTSGSGSGVFVQDSNPHFTHSTIARNTGGDESGICARITSTVRLTNTIVASHTVGITVEVESAAIINGVLWYANGLDTGGAGDITVTQAFTGFPAFLPDGYHIATNSAARDVGIDAGVAVDVDGDLRPQGEGYDVGADELLAVTIDGGTGGTITHVGEEGQMIVVQAAPGTVGDAVTLVFAAIPSSTLPISPGLRHSGIAFDLDAFCYTSYSVYLPLVLRNQSSGSGTVAAINPVRSAQRCGTSPPLGSSSPCSPTFQTPVTITIHYSDADVAGLDKSTLRLYHWTGSRWGDGADTCASASSYVTSTAGNLLQVAICHLSRWGLAGR